MTTCSANRRTGHCEVPMTALVPRWDTNICLGGAGLPAASLCPPSAPWLGADRRISGSGAAVAGYAASLSRLLAFHDLGLRGGK